jgi:hypothetical protein
METITLQVPEAQVLEWVQQLSPSAKQQVIRTLLPELDRLEALVDYGGQRVRSLCAQRGVNWEALSDAEREALIDAWLHEPPFAP